MADNVVEIGKFISYNADSINIMNEQAPDIAKAFTGVMKVLAKKYGGVSIDDVATPSFESKWRLKTEMELERDIPNWKSLTLYEGINTAEIKRLAGTPLKDLIDEDKNTIEFATKIIELHRDNGISVTIRTKEGKNNMAGYSYPAELFTEAPLIDDIDNSDYTKAWRFVTKDELIAFLNSVGLDFPTRYKLQNGNIPEYVLNQLYGQPLKDIIVNPDKYDIIQNDIYTNYKPIRILYKGKVNIDNTRDDERYDISPLFFTNDVLNEQLRTFRVYSEAELAIKYGDKWIENEDITLGLTLGTLQQYFGKNISQIFDSNPSWSKKMQELTRLKKGHGLDTGLFVLSRELFTSDAIVKSVISQKSQKPSSGNIKDLEGKILYYTKKGKKYKIMRVLRNNPKNVKLEFYDYQKDNYLTGTLNKQTALSIVNDIKIEGLEVSEDNSSVANTSVDKPAIDYSTWTQEQLETEKLNLLDALSYLDEDDEEYKELKQQIELLDMLID